LSAYSSISSCEIFPSVSGPASSRFCCWAGLASLSKGVIRAKSPAGCNSQMRQLQKDVGPNRETHLSHSDATSEINHLQIFTQNYLNLPIYCVSRTGILACPISEHS